MLRKLLIAGLAAGLTIAAPAWAAGPIELMPGVKYTHGVQFTLHGPVSYYQITAPPPNGLYGLKPALSNGLVTGRETVTGIEKRVAAEGTVVGVNGDFFNWSAGYPSGILMQDGNLVHQSLRGRSALGIDNQGFLHVDRVASYGTWKGLGQRRTVQLLNQPPANGEVALFTAAWGPRTPKIPGAYQVVLQPFGPLVPNADVTGTVVQTALNGNTPIPPDGAVLMARGPAAPPVSAEAPNGTEVTIRIILQPDWVGVVDALGGGPVLVRDGTPVFRSNEDLTSDQLFGRDPRTAVGQRADGTLVMIACDGRQPGYSVGMSNWDLAQTLVRLGAVTGMALDSGGSTTVAFDGQLLSRPSDPTGERPVAEALLLFYYGVYSPLPTAPVLSPNGDGVDEQQTLSYRLVRPSLVDARLVGPGGVLQELDQSQRDPGVYTFTWTGQLPDGTPAPEGRWQWQVSATDDEGQSSFQGRGFWLNDTLGSLAVQPARVRVGPLGGALTAGFTLTRQASLTVTVESLDGTVLATVARGAFFPGRKAVVWRGRFTGGRLAYSGGYVLHVAASNSFGRSDLDARFAVRRVAARK